MAFKLRASLSFVVVPLFLILMAGCGSGNQTTNPAPEGFTNANLKGTYAFEVSGQNNGVFFSIAGSLQANGSGSITGGTVDINAPGTLQASNQPVTGTYSTLSDGRTVANLTANVGGTAFPFTIDFVLLSNSNGLVVQLNNGITASGSIDLQDSTAFSDTVLAGSFAFNLSGVDANDASEATAGAFTFNSAGTITTGVQDLIDNGVVEASGATITGGTVFNPANGRGTLSFSNASQSVTLTFAFYVIDANHIRLLEIDASPILSGDAFRQPATFTTSTALPAGSFAFTVAAVEGNTVIAAGGIITADGNGNITSGTEDVNENGLTANIALTGTYTMANTGRGTLSLTGSGHSFTIYPTMTGGLLLFGVNLGVASGTALQQTSTSFSNSSINGTYGLNLSGVNLNSQTEVDSIAQFTADGNGNIKGAMDFNNELALSPNLALTGTYSIPGNGHGTGTLNSSQGNFQVIYYVVSSSKVLFIEADTAQPSVGLFAQQTM